MGAFENAKIPEGTEYYLSTEGLAEYSENENIFVFVLDYMDYDYISFIRESNPEFFDDFDGFVGYTDALSTFGRTKPSVCNILTGCSEGAYAVPSSEFMDNAWGTQKKNILTVLQEQGYSIEMYASLDEMFFSPEPAIKYISNIEQKSDAGLTIEYGMMLRKLIYLSVYRYAPMCIKPFFWEYTSFYNEGVLSDAGMDSSIKMYSSDDISVCNSLAEATANRQQKSFKLYHMTGSHPPCYLNRNGEYMGPQTDEYAQTMGCLTLMKNVFHQMKSLGIYENATIIMTADHGDPMKMWQEPFPGMQIALFYKPSGSLEVPLIWSDVQVGTMNIPATVAQAAGAKSDQFGLTLDDVGTETVERTFYRVYGKENGSNKELFVDRYTVLGKSKDFSNWRLEETRDVIYPFD